MHLNIRAIALSAVAALGSGWLAGQASLERRHRELDALFDQEWEYELSISPELATSIGDERYNDRLSDHSASAFRSQIQEREQFLAKFEAIDPAGLSAADALSRTLMIRKLREQIEEARFKPWEMPVNQMAARRSASPSSSV